METNQVVKTVSFHDDASKLPSFSNSKKKVVNY